MKWHLAAALGLALACLPAFAGSEPARGHHDAARHSAAGVHALDPADNDLFGDWQAADKPIIGNGLTHGYYKDSDLNEDGYIDDHEMENGFGIPNLKTQG